MTGTETMTIADAIAARRSIRSYRPNPLEEAHVRALIRAAVQAPTAMHVEPWLFVVIQDRQALQRFSDVAKSTMIKDAQLYRDLHDPSLTPKNGGFLKTLARPDFNIFYDAGTLILICARLTTPFVSADCWLAAENLMLAAAGMGLGTCCIGSALSACNTPDVKKELDIPPDVSVVVAIIAGTPSAAPPAVERKPAVILTWKKAAR